MRVAIPSRGRPDFLSKKVFTNPIVFVEPQEYEAYLAKNTDLEVVSIEANNKGISYARNYIMDYFRKKEDKLYCIADDDIKQLYIADGKTYKKIHDDSYMLEEVEKLFKESEVCAVGLTPKAYCWCQKEKLRERGKILNIVFFHRERSEPLRYDENISHGEDVDICIQMARSNLKFGLLNSFTYVNETKKLEGGCGLRSKADILRNIDYMNLKWGDCLTPVIDGERVGIRIKWMR